MDSHFASPERLPPEELRRQVAAISKNPVIDGLLHSVGGMLAVLNEHRQILAVNPAYAGALGIQDPEGVLGLRTGESLGCAHAHDMPAGCGTSEHCASCGAAIAIASALCDGEPVERTCALAVGQHSGGGDLYLKVRACPVSHESGRLILLFIQDITLEQNNAYFSRALFHDIRNVLTPLTLTIDALPSSQGERLHEDELLASDLARHLAMEFAILQAVGNQGKGVLPMKVERIAVEDVFADVRSWLAKLPVAMGQEIRTACSIPGLGVESDRLLLTRLLLNMAVNALEAGGFGEEIRIAAEARAGELTFSVWNRQAIPATVAKRVFQLNFSTKGGLGRGVGTYSMRLLGEKYLGGRVEFVSSLEEGTTFRFHCRAEWAA